MGVETKWALMREEASLISEGVNGSRGCGGGAGNWGLVN